MTLKLDRIALNSAGRRIGQSHPRARWPDALIERLFALRDCGYGYKRIASALGMPVRTVRDVCKGRSRNQYCADTRPVIR